MKMNMVTNKERERKENEAQKRINKVFFIFSYIMLYDITLWVAKNRRHSHSHGYNVCIITIYTIYTYIICTTMTVEADMNQVKSSQAKSSQAKPTRVEPSRAELS